MAFYLHVQNFRSHCDYSVEIPDTTTIITGSNGSGKTSLIEALYLAYVGKSWRSNFDEISRRIGEQVSDWWRIDLADTVVDDRRTIKYVRGQKSFIINDREYHRLPMSGHRPVILFEPNDMQLLYGSPSRRRQFLDRFIAQLEPVHQTELNKFDRVLRQRNNLLKQEHWTTDEMLVWNIQFSSLSSTITDRRRQYLTKIDNVLMDKYQTIAGSNDAVKLRFSAGAPRTASEILTALSGSQEHVTAVGAQRDDYRFIFRGKDAKTAASRGENRTIIFAMLGAIADLAREAYGDQVVILLDDIDSELDQQHRANLYGLDSFSHNTIATTLDCADRRYYNVRLS